MPAALKDWGNSLVAARHVAGPGYNPDYIPRNLLEEVYLPAAGTLEGDKKRKADPGMISKLKSKKRQVHKERITTFANTTPWVARCGQRGNPRKESYYRS